MANAKKPPRKMFVCKLCNVVLSSTIEFCEHVVGMKHRTNVGNFSPLERSQLYKLQYFLDTYIPQEPLVGLEFVEEVQMNGGYRYRCALCGFKGERKAFFAHLIGSAHITNFLKTHAPQLSVHRAMFEHYTKYVNALQQASTQYCKMHGRKKIKEIEGCDDDDWDLDLQNAPKVVPDSKTVNQDADFHTKSHHNVEMSNTEQHEAYVCEPRDMTCPQALELRDHMVEDKNRTNVGHVSSVEQSEHSKLQYFLDTHIPEEPLVGLEFVEEILGNSGYYYRCALCGFSNIRNPFFAHLTGSDHIANFLQTHAPRLYMPPTMFVQPARYVKALQHASAQYCKMHGRRKIKESEGCDRDLVVQNAPKMVPDHKTATTADQDGDFHTNSHPNLEKKDDQCDRDLDMKNEPKLVLDHKTMMDADQDADFHTKSHPNLEKRDDKCDRDLDMKNAPKPVLDHKTMMDADQDADFHTKSHPSLEKTDDKCDRDLDMKNAPKPVLDHKTMMDADQDADFHTKSHPNLEKRDDKCDRDLDMKNAPKPVLDHKTMMDADQDADFHTKSHHKVEMVNTKEQKLEAYVCELCDVSCSSALELCGHVVGKEHWMNVGHVSFKELSQLNKLQYFLDTYIPQEPLVGLEYVEEIQMKNGYYYKCVLCGFSSKRNSFFKHLTGSEHITNFLKTHTPELSVCRTRFEHHTQYVNALQHASAQYCKRHGRTKIKDIEGYDRDLVVQNAPKMVPNHRTVTTANQDGDFHTKSLPNPENKDDQCWGPPLEFKNNSDFLDYLGKFEIRNDEDAGVLKRILQNCTQALERFRDELTGNTQGLADEADKDSSMVNSGSSVGQVAPAPESDALQLFYSRIKNMKESEVVDFLHNIAATNPAFREISVPNTIRYLQTTGYLKPS